MGRKKKKKTDRTLVASTFADLYKLTGETLGEGSYGKVETCVNIYTGLEYAVKVIEKRPGFYCRPNISPQAKDLIQRLLVKDSGARLDANQVLDHPWILYGGNSNSLMTPTVLRRQTSIKDLEDFASRAMAVNRAVEDEDEKVKFPTRLPWKSETWSIKPSSSPSCSSLAPSSELLSKRRRSRVNFWDKMNEFCSIDELDLESDFFMKAIV